MQKQKYTKEIIMALTGFTLWTISDSCIRYLNSYPTILVAFFGAFFCVILLLVLSPFLGGLKATFTMPQLKLRIFRGAVLSCSSFLAFVAFSNIDLATAYAFIFAAPFISKILSVLILKENIRMRSWLISALGFVGVLIVLRPGIITISIGAAAALGLAVFFSFGYVLTRYIKSENQTLLSMALFQYAFVALFTAYPAYLTIQTTQSFNPDILHTGIIIFYAFAVTFGSLFASKAYADAPTSVIAPIQYVQMLSGIILGAVLFAEYPDIWTLTGGGIIIAAGLLLIKFTRSV